MYFVFRSDNGRKVENKDSESNYQIVEKVFS